MKKGKVVLYFVLFALSLYLAFGASGMIFGNAVSIIGTSSILLVFIIFYLVAASKTKKYVNQHEIKDASTIKIALSLTFLTYFFTITLARFSIGRIFLIYIMFLVYGILGTIAHIFVRGHRIMQGKNDITTILYGLTYHCWQVLQMIILVVRTVIDIIASFIVDDWKQSNKRTQAKEQTEKYFREVSIDKPVNYSDGLNIEYRDFIKTTSMEDNADTRKIFADKYFQAIYNK